jgi:sugar/nucleoside kinase (ribokinase family)
MAEVTVIGDVNIDLLLSPIKNYPKKDFQQKIPWLKVEVGGGAAHVALALSKLGVKTKLIGLIGKDSFGNFIIEKIENFGIENGLRAIEKETGISIGINFEDGSRSLLTYRGTNSLFSIHNFNLSEIGGRILFLTGYGLLEKFRKDMKKVLKFAKRKGMITCLEPDVKGGINFKRKEFFQILKFVDFLFPDFEEAKSLTQEKNLEKILKKFFRFGCKIVALKLGEKGCIIAKKDKMIKIPAIKTKVVNPTGAGDFFNAGFVFGFLKYNSLEKAGIFGNATASFAISKFGDERYVSEKDIRKIMKKAKFFSIFRFT